MRELFSCVFEGKANGLKLDADFHDMRIPSFQDDRKNLKNDRKNIVKDFQKAFSQRVAEM